MIQNKKNTVSVAKSIKKWAIISALGIIFYLFGYFYSLSQFQPSKIEVIRQQPLALIYPG
jgi:uncharacterized membrane protein YdjX (TVP38/TMEM64 family)